MQAAMPLPVSASMPMPTGSLDAYIQTVNRFPLLSAEEERRLALRFRGEGDLEAARTLVLSHLRLVVAIARGYLGYGLPHGDRDRATQQGRAASGVARRGARGGAG